MSHPEKLVTPDIHDPYALYEALPKEAPR